MKDISICTNEDCSKKETCLRYTSEPDSHWQSYFRPNEKDCEYYIPEERIDKQTRSTGKQYVK